MYIQANSTGPEAPGTGLVEHLTGMGCPCAGGGLGCACGMGLFDSGMDVTQWTWQEWAVVGVGAYALFSMLFTAGEGARRVHEGTRKRVRRARRRVGRAIGGEAY